MEEKQWQENKENLSDAALKAGWLGIVAMNGVKEISDTSQINENNIFHTFTVSSTGTMENGRRQVHIATA